MGEMNIQEFRVGEIVHIVTDPVRKGPGWAAAMNRYLGSEAEITHPASKEGWYRLNVDGGHFWWCREMFQEFYGPYTPEPDLDEAEIDSVVESLLGEFKRV